MKRKSFGIEDKRLRVENELSNLGIGNQKSEMRNTNRKIGNWKDH